MDNGPQHPTKQNPPDLSGSQVVDKELPPKVDHDKPKDEPIQPDNHGFEHPSDEHHE